MAASSSSKRQSSRYHTSKSKSSGYPCDRQVWPLINLDLTNRAFNPRSTITKESLDEEVILQRTPIFEDGKRVSSFIGGTADHKTAYFTTQGLFTTEGESLGNQGYLIALNRETKEVKWKKLIGDYTGRPNDASRSGPAVTSKYLFLASRSEGPQTFATPENPDRKGYNLFTGKEITTIRGPPFLMCVNKETGGLVWKSEIGKKAEFYDSEDNQLSVTMSPLVFKAFVAGKRRTVVAIGTSSFQSIQPYIQSESPNTVFSPPPDTALTLKQTDGHVVSDVGRMVFYDAKTGEELATTFAGPPLLKEGDKLDNSAPVALGGGFLWPGSDTFRVWHNLNLNEAKMWSKCGVPKAFRGDQHFSWFLENWFGQGSKRVPEVLDGVVTSNRFGKPVILVGGSKITDELEGASIVLRGSLDRSTLYLNKFVDREWTTVKYPVSEVALSLSMARLWKYLRDGDVLEKQDAQGINYYGASCWGSSPVVLRDKKGVATHMIVTTGQSHQLPAEDVERLAALRPLYVALTRNIRRAEERFLKEKSPATFKLLQEAVGRINQFNNELLLVKKSPRSERHHFCSVMVICLYGKKFGQIVDYHHALGYDTWNFGYTQLSLRALEEDGEVAVNAPGQSLQYQTLFTDVQAYLGAPHGPDGDFGNGPVYFPKTRELVACNKHGNFLLFDIGKYGNLKLKGQRRLGLPGVEGGSNYGVTADDTTLYTNIGNAQQYGNWNLKEFNGSWGDVQNYPPPQSFPSLASWFQTPDQRYEPLASYVAAVDLKDRSIKWLKRYATEKLTSYNNSSCNSELLFALAGDGNLAVLDKETGDILAKYDLEQASQSQAMILGRELVILSGREFSSPTANTEFAPTPYITTLTFEEL